MTLAEAHRIKTLADERNGFDSYRVTHVVPNSEGTDEEYLETYSLEGYYTATELEAFAALANRKPPRETL